MPLLDDLNERQREAVLATEGPVLVLAGAGTGKTRVITYRVAQLIEQGVDPSSILAVTFTNKAADQMKQRITDLLRATGHDSSDLWACTFHSFCARLLRREAPRIGLPRDFAIYDEDDQTAAVRVALDRLQIDKKLFPPRALLSRFSYAKNHGVTPEQMLTDAEGRRDPEGVTVADLFAEYDAILRKSAAVDFDDLLLKAVQMLREHPEARLTWSERFHYLQVDEFQDTNRHQEELVRLLAGARRNVCVVGDEDQSIYSWRGAEAGNLQKFTEDFPGAKLIRLEENYRSTQTILDAAAAVVGNNTRRLGKTLLATKESGAALRFFEAQDGSGEAEFVSAEISRLGRENSDAHFAALYRTNFQSRSLEEALRRLGIRYRLVGGFSFYQRSEVKDALAYVRLVLHPEDDIALLRVVNTPPRGLGDKSIATLEAQAKADHGSLWAAIGTTLENGTMGRAAGALKSFRDLITGLREECREAPPPELLRLVLDRTNYADWIAEQDRLEHTTRTENLAELANAVAEAAESGETLEDVLDHAALVSDADDYDESAHVTLMTLHSAKGLEFDHVFLVGLEEGLFPHSRSLNQEKDIEEERRLCYVGMTRAKQSLTLTRAVYRRIYGEERLRASTPSRFLQEIPAELIESAAGSLADAGETRRYEPDPDYLESRYVRSGGRSGRGTGRSGGSSGGGSRTNPLVGVRVRHPKFGVGTILAIEEDGSDRKFTISFSDYGTKKLLERYAQLEWA
ncbi:MAG: ATP-dependent helicase [Candidatus Acidiferrales bacterium]